MTRLALCYRSDQKKKAIATASEQDIRAQLFQAVMEFVLFFLLVTDSVQQRC